MTLVPYAGTFGHVSPLYIGVARVEGKVEPTLPVSKDANIHHDVLVPECCLAFQVKDDSHVVLVVCGIESSDIDSTFAKAVSVIGSV